MYFTGNAVTDIGISKKINQDSLTLKIANSKWGPVCLAVICDGVGGLSKGEIASGNVIRAFDLWFREVFPASSIEWKEEAVEKAFKELILSLNQELYEYGLEQNIVLGTTVTAVLWIGMKYYAAHVGDCRLYRVNQDIRQLTKDQTVIAMEIEKGILTEEEAKHDPRKNVLLQSVGSTEWIDPVCFSGTVSQGDCYLLCTDGFRHVITEEEMKTELQAVKNEHVSQMEMNLQKLVALNKSRGETDNISAILVRVG